MALVYFKLFSANFISWDDADVLLTNKDVHRFDLKAFFSKHYVGNYAPITMISFAIDWFLFKGSAVLQHAVNLVFHFVNAVLVYKLAEILLKDRWKAFFVCIVFCFHPTQIETIAWVAAKNNLVSTLFFLLALIYYIKYSKEHKLKFYVYSFILFIVSTLSKPSAVSFPICLFAIDYFLGQPITLKSIRIKIPFFIVSIIIGIITIYTRTEDKFITSDHLYTLIERIGFAGYALGFYVYKFLLPFNLSVVYAYPQEKMLPIIVGYILIVLLGSYLYFLFKKKQYLKIGAILFIISNLMLVLQFIPFGEVITADRYMYIPLIGFAFLVLFLFNFSDKHIRFVSLGLIILYGTLTFFRCSVWKDSITLYSDIVKKYPNSFLALNSLGAEYMLNNNPEKAYLYLNKAIAVSPQYYKGYYNRGLLNAQNNKYENAISDLSKAINYHKLKNNIKAYVARGNVYYKIKDFPKAIGDGKSALVIDDKNAKAQFLLANCYDDLNLLDTALFYYNTAINLDSENASYYLRRAIVYGKLQQFSTCLQDLDRCTTLNSNYAEAYYWKGVVKVNLKQNPCADLKKALDLGFTAAENPLRTYCR